MRLLSPLCIGVAALVAGCGGGADSSSTNQTSVTHPQTAATTTAAAAPPASRVCDTSVPEFCAIGQRTFGAVFDQKKKKVSVVPPAPPGTNPPPGTGPSAGSAQAILNDTYARATQWAQYVVTHNLGGYPYRYAQLVRPQDCQIAPLSSVTGRCLVYLWVEEENFYGLNGGIQRSIWRRNYLATWLGAHNYTDQVLGIDFDAPWSWVCSDAPLTNTPLCTPNGPRF